MSRNLSLKLRYGLLLILLGLIAFLEARQPFASFRLVSFILAFLALACSASLLRGKWRDGFVVLTSLAFGLSFVETIAVIFDSRSLPVLAKGFTVPQPVIGLGPEHAGRFHSEKTNRKSGGQIYSVDYTIDSNLLRETKSIDTGPTIAFFGDSFTFGEGLNDADTLPQRFADLLDRKQRVLNLGYPAYGPQQFLAELQTGRFDKVIGEQPRLFIFQTAAGHAERTSCKPFWVRRWPRYELENGEVVLKGTCHDGPTQGIRVWIEHMASFRLFVEPYLQRITHDDVELYIRILLAATKLAKEKYGVATLIPYSQTLGSRYLDGTGFTDDEIVQRLREGGAMVVDVSLAKEEAAGAPVTIKGDGHPTALANRLKASILKEYIEHHVPGILVADLQ
ncbi:MAG TPA: SGNH/GDSL hydrolase family protein [Methylocella sp.]|nr:SGNH/GDSL hydrolase family protein [Methylocella sp.]